MLSFVSQPNRIIEVEVQLSIGGERKIQLSGRCINGVTAPEGSFHVNGTFSPIDACNVIEFDLQKAVSSSGQTF